MYAVKCNGNGRFDQWYVAPSGSSVSYTPLLQKAKLYRTLDEAKRDCCGNETIVSVESEFKGEQQ